MADRRHRRRPGRGRRRAGDLVLFLAAMAVGAGIGAAVTARDQQLHWVVVAARDIPAGTFITGDYLTTRLNWVHRDERGLARDPAEVIGRVATDGVFAGTRLRALDVTLARLPEPPAPEVGADVAPEVTDAARVEPAAAPPSGRARLEARLAATPEPPAIELAGGAVGLTLAAGPEAILDRLRERLDQMAEAGGEAAPRFAGPVGAILSASSTASGQHHQLAAVANGSGLR